MNTEIYLIRNNVNAGPYSESEVIARVKDGRYAATDLAWSAGCTGPLPLIDILCNPSTPEATAPEPIITKPATTKLTQKAPAPNPGVFLAGDLRLIAENYRMLLVVATTLLVAAFIPMPDTMSRLMNVALGGMWIRYGWQISKGLHRNRWAWAICSLIPLVNLFVLVRILRDAYRTLNANGIPIRWFGPDHLSIAGLIEAEKAATQV